MKPANLRENHRDRRLRQNQSGKRQVVVVIRERDGKTLPGVFASEVAALNFIRSRIARGTEVYADEAGAWNELHGRFTMHRINHQEAYSLGDGIHSLERLVLRTAFAAPVLAGRLSREESRQTLTEWLNLNSASADQTFGEHFQDPALAALYSDEIRNLIDNMIATVESFYEGSKGAF